MTREYTRRRWLSLPIAVLLLAAVVRAEVPVLENGEAKVRIVADIRETTTAGADVLNDAAGWLAESLECASGAEFVVSNEPGDQPSLVIARADVWPQIARATGLKTQQYDDYAIATRPDEHRIYVLGNSAESSRFGVADLLRRWGFRWFAPSDKWHVAPTLKHVAVDLNFSESPHLIERRIWYAYGMRGDDLKPLMQNYQRWSAANRLTLHGLTRTGHSYGNIIGRNAEAFTNNPELSAMKVDGSRDTTSVPNARKFCFSNPALIQLVAEDRRRLLETNRKANPAAFMVSVDPSDGEGTCHCENCRRLGTTTDRVFHLANEVARRLRKDDPRAWVGLYAYSSHRLPPSIEVEPNVYVQVAMGFNRTQYSLPELVERWSQKVSAIGLREYYGVEAWDWGLPGRARGGRVEYHRKWIPFYAERNLNGINAETNANWGAQALGLYVAAQLMWDPQADVDSIVDDFLQQLFGDASETMRSFYQKMEAAPPLRPSTLLPRFDDLQAVWSQSDDPSVRARLVDLMAYLVYVAEFRQFDLVRSRSSEHGDPYYDRVRSLMNYAWRIRHRDVIHYYALARRLCNAAPLKDGRPEFSLRYDKGSPVWQHGDLLSDSEVIARFQQSYAAMKADDDPTVHFSRYFDPVKVGGDDAGASHIHSTPQEDVAVSRFRRGLRGYLVPSGAMTAKLGIAPSSKPVSLTVFMRDDAIFEQEYGAAESFHHVEIELPRAFEYRVEITGDFELQVPSTTPFIFESSVSRPAWISYSGPHYFYVPRGTRDLIVDASPRLSLVIPGQGRRDLHPADRVAGKSHITVKVPAGADGQLWHTTTLTRGQIMLLNTPPLFSFHRTTVFVPRELSESEGLSTKR
jgi:hypothetical protein